MSNSNNTNQQPTRGTAIAIGDGIGRSRPGRPQGRAHPGGGQPRHRRAAPASRPSASSSPCGTSPAGPSSAAASSRTFELADNREASRLLQYVAESGIRRRDAGAVPPPRAGDLRAADGRRRLSRGAAVRDGQVADSERLRWEGSARAGRAGGGVGAPPTVSARPRPRGAPFSTTRGDYTMNGKKKPAQQDDSLAAQLTRWQKLVAGVQRHLGVLGYAAEHNTQLEKLAEEILNSACEQRVLTHRRAGPGPRAGREGAASPRPPQPPRRRRDGPLRAQQRQAEGVRPQASAAPAGGGAGEGGGRVGARWTERVAITGATAGRPWLRLRDDQKLQKRGISSVAISQNSRLSGAPTRRKSAKR